MKRGALLCLVFLTLTYAANAAPQTSSLPTAGPAPVPQPSPIFPQGGRSSSTLAIQLPSNTVPEALTLHQIIVHTYTQDLYRKPTEKESISIAPQSGVANHYRDFLKNERTGIFKLVLDRKCDENTKVISASEDCLKYTMPGSGSSYSFRVGTYRMRDLADLTYSEGVFSISGLMTQGLLVNLGDIPIEKVSLESDGLKYLGSFQPVTNFEAARAIDDEIVGGVTSEGFLYKRSLPAIENTTYGLRAVAYRGKLFRSVRGIPYNEFDFDKRRDVIVVFRVAYKDENGGLTIVWSELRNVDSPRLAPPATSPSKSGEARR